MKRRKRAASTTSPRKQVCPAVKRRVQVQSESHCSSVEELKALSFGVTSPGPLLRSQKSSYQDESSQCTLSSPGRLREDSEGSLQISPVSKGSPGVQNVVKEKLDWCIKSSTDGKQISREESAAGVIDSSLPNEISQTGHSELFKSCHGNPKVQTLGNLISGQESGCCERELSNCDNRQIFVQSCSIENPTREGPIFQSAEVSQTKCVCNGLLRRYQLIVGITGDADLNTAGEKILTGTEEEQQVTAEAESIVHMKQLNLSDDEIRQNERTVCPSGLNLKTGENSTEQIVNNPHKAKSLHRVSLLRPKERNDACSGKEPLLKDGISTSDLNLTSIRKKTVKSPIAISVTPGNASEGSEVSRENAGVQDKASQRTGNTAVLEGSSGEDIKLYRENHFLKSTPIRKLVRLVALSPAIKDLIKADSLDLLVGFCWSGCLRMSCYSELLWKRESTGVSQPYCKYCCTKGLVGPTKIDFWFLGKVRSVSEEMDVIFSSRFAAKFLGCSVSAYLRSSRIREQVHQRLGNLIKDAKWFNLAYLVVQSPQGAHYRAL